VVGRREHRDDSVAVVSFGLRERSEALDCHLPAECRRGCWSWPSSCPSKDGC